MKLVRLSVGLALIAALVCLAAPARAEEIILKNGEKIVGTIVGYEKDMFRVETEYGIALVRKDKVASIQVNKPDAAKSSPEAPKRESTERAGAKPATPAAPEAAPVAPPGAAGASTNRKSPSTNSDSPAAMAPAVSQAPPSATPVLQAKPPAPPPSAPGPEVAPTVSPVAAPAIANHQAPITNSPPPVAMAPAAAPKPPPPPPPPPVSHPLDVPMPAHLQEHVDGNTYFSDTFQFAMFKPPDWKIYEGVPKETGSGIMAMGTEDEQTLLIVDRQVWSGTPKLSSDQVEANLRQTYQEYQRISEDAIECDGQTATRRTFSGVLDGAEWHGVAVHVIHGNTVFGIIGLTSAETFQFQQAIFNKVIRTFHFLTPATPSAALPTANPAP